MTIPAILHLVWIGEPMPAQIAANVATWRTLHPAWTVRVWGNEAFDVFRHDAWLRTMRADPRADLAQIANRLRFLVLERFGGFYVDADARAVRPLDSLRRDVPCALAGLPARLCRPDRVCDPSAAAAVPGVPGIHALLEQWFPTQPRWPRAGPMAEFLRVNVPGLVVWPWQYFCGRKLEPRAFAVHWPFRLGSWLNRSTR